MLIIMHGKKRSLKVNLVKFTFSFLIICCLAMGMFSFFGNEPVALSANEECDVVCVAYGDTLWSIAAEYNDGAYDTRKIVNDIIAQNNLDSSSLYAGQVLEIPGIYCA